MHTLVTIPFSHFCEKARWSLDAAGLSYREEGHIPGFHRRAVRRVGGRRSVPVLVLDDGAVLDDSPLIVKFADARAPDDGKLLPVEGAKRQEATALERHLDVDFAPHVRLFVYHYLLPDRAQVLRLFDLQTPRVEQLAVRLAFPLLRSFMRRFMRIDARRALEARDQVRRVLDEVGQKLADGRPYLMGDRFGAVDIAFAAFAAPVTLPTGHPATGPWSAILGSNLDGLPPPFADEVKAARQSPAGRFAARLYERRRRRHRH
jgi:glutathione S-transferase